MNFTSIIIVIALLWILTACSIVQVHGTDSVKTSFGFGILNVTVTPVDGVVRTKTASLGIAVGNSHFNAGWLHEDVVVVSDDCVVAFIVEAGADISELQKILNDFDLNNNKICVAK